VQLQEELLQAFAAGKPSVPPGLPDALDSLVLREGDRDWEKRLQFLRESFGRPVRLALMFRASEHDFSAKAFHAHCDNTEDTLTLVRTEFGRALAGYSHYTWNAVSSGSYVQDEGPQAFLLSFDQKEKYVPQRGGYLIYCSPSYGPTFGGPTFSGPIFGGGNDLAIADRCNANSNSHANFPWTYNREGSSKIERCQQSYTDFCGAPSGKYFRVLEYEVFRVLFQ
jgi:hypothetical protein